MMHKKMLPEAEKYTKQNQLRRIWRKFVRFMACIVVFCTTYALILPAITLEKKCGLDEHVHTESCYTQITTQQTEELACSYELLDVHTHTQACYEENGNRICGLADYLVHTHHALCFDESGALVCQLPEIKEHVHTEDCCRPVQTEPVPEETKVAGEVHTHDESCYTIQLGELVCEIAETEGHTHTGSCYLQGELLCQKEETEGHTHGESCSETVLICDSTEEDHTHTESCYQTNLLCDIPESEGHSHSSECYESILNCDQDEVEAHRHADSCYEQIPVLTCQQDELAGETEATESTEAAQAEQELVCGKEEIKLHSHMDACYETYQDESGAEQKRLICTETVVLAHTHSASCISVREETVDTENLTCTLTEGHIHNEDCYDETQQLTCTEPEDHTHSALCYGTWELTCGLEEHTHTSACNSLSEEEQARVDLIIAMIDALPTADEIDAKLREFEVNGDPLGEETYYMEISQRVTRTYHYYSILSDTQKAAVTNADKLMELEYIWSVTKLAAVSSYDVMEVNSYTSAQTGALIVRGGRGITVGQSAAKREDNFTWWYAIVVVQEDGQYVVKEVHRPGANASKANVYAPYDGFILLLHEETINEPVVVSVGNYVSMGGSSFWRHTKAYTGEVYGTVKFHSTPVDHVTPYWREPTPVTDAADTDQFIELNLYNYGLGSNSADVNDRFRNETYSYNGYSGVTMWPGFQWNGGAYNLNGNFHRHQVDYIDFGNSLITDLTYIRSSASYDYGKAFGAVAVGKIYNSSNTETVKKTGIINTLWRNGTDNRTLTNRPIGMSMNGSTADTTYDVLKPVLTAGGYPVILASDAVSGFNGVLNYLFTDNIYANKVNSGTIDGLFQINPTSGEYYFNSRWNHAQYDSESNTFRLYEEVITPNFIVYPFGNFLPFNTITDGLTSADVNMITSGKLKNYLAEEIALKLSNDDSSESQLKTMLSLYRTSLGADSGNASAPWYTYSGLDAIQDYFWGDGGTSDDVPSIHTSDIAELVGNGLYNIDFDVQTDFFFGMEMSMRFYQPKDGLTGYDNGDNAEGTWSTVATNIPAYRRSALYVEEDTRILSESPDGIPDYPMRFYFAGDDDVWIFIDGILFLDLTGIHRHVGGEIDFQKGVVNYYELDTANTGDISKIPYKTFTFADLVAKAVRFRHRNDATAYPEASVQADVNAVINPKTGTFYDYSMHDFKFFFLERGSGSSVCRINFNFPMLRRNSISVVKELTSTPGVQMMGNPDFSFQIMRADAAGNPTQTPFFGAGVEYTIFDSATNAQIGTGTTGDYGIFTLKAGQRAEFTGITEDSGKFYVRELLNSADISQFYSITVDGSATTVSNDVTLNSELFKGRESPVKDISDGTTVFHFDNQVAVDLLGSLSVSKQLESVTGGDADKVFQIIVTLDGQPLPKGTVYTLSDGSTGTVDPAGVIPLKDGQTATIANILSGTHFTVSESTGSAEGYIVGYSQTDADNVSVSAAGVSGIIRVDKDVQVVVSNAENAASVTIPGIKTLSNGSWSRGEHTYSFILRSAGVQDANGTALDLLADYQDSKTVTVSSTETAEFAFALPYTAAQFADVSAFPVTITYEIRESPEGVTDAATDPAVYTATVTVNREDSGMITAELISLKKDGTAVSNQTAAFVNTLTSDLSLKKIVDGGYNAQMSSTFTFRVTLKNASDTPISKQSFLVTASEGVSPNGTVTTDANGVITLTGIGHNDQVVIHGLPAGTRWTITEENADGYIVSWQSGTGSTQGMTASGELPCSGTEVVFTNTSTYELPQTGNAGTQPYTMAGLVLIILSTAYLLYRSKARRRGAC